MEYGDYWRLPSPPTMANKPGNLTVVGEYLPHKPPAPQRIRKTVTKIQGDPDHDSYRDIYSRLEKGEVTGAPLLVYTSCDCVRSSPQLSRKQRELYKSQSSDSSGSQGEEEDVDISVLLKMLRGLQNRPEHKISTKAFTGVLDSFTSTSVLTDQQFTEIWEALDSSNIVIKELSLLLLTTVCRQMENAVLLLDRGVLHVAESILSMYGKNQLYPAIVKLLNAIISHSDLKVTWMDPVLSIFVPAFLAYLRTEAPLDHKYPMCCFFLTLSQHQEFLGIIQQEVIPIVALIKDQSSKLKETYTGMLMSLARDMDSLPPDLSDQGIVSTAASLLKDGPCLLQVQALSLLTVVGQSDAGIADIIDNTNAVPYTLCCVKHTKCRKVRAKALELVGLLGATRRLGLCKDLMSHIANYLIPSNSDLVLNNSDTRSRSPVKGRYERESQLWRGLDKLVELICDILCKDAMVERDNLGSVMGIRYNPCVDMCSPRLDSLIQCLTVLHNVCIWPASKSKHQVTKVDLTNFTDDEGQRSRLHKLNKTQAQALWDTVGTVVMEILLVFSKKVSNVSRIARDMRDGSRETCEKHRNKKEEERPNSSFSPKVTDKIGAVDLFAVFEEKEIELIIKILEFLLVVSLCTCKEFKDFTTKTKNKSSKKNLLGGCSTKSDTCLGRSSSPEKLTKSASAVYRPSSPTKLCEEDHTKKQHKDLLEKEAATDRRLMRKCLYEADIFSAVAPFIYCTHTNCQTLALQIIRCTLQPLEERVVQFPRGEFNKAELSRGKEPITLASILRLASQVLRCNVQPLEERFISPIKPQTPTNASASSKIRPMSAVSSTEADRKLNIALHRMSPHIAEIMKDAIGVRVRPLSATIPAAKMEEDSGVTERLSQYVKTHRPESAMESIREEGTKPVLDPSLPIVDQCRSRFLQECGPHVLTGMFSPSWDIKHACILLLQDIVQYGNVSVHMKLSEYGCVKKLVDFLRVNTDDNLMEITGLIMVQILVSSDIRLKQVFNRHGGTRLLMAMSQFTSGEIKQEVTKTLKTVTRGTSKQNVRPSSAPVIRSAPKTPDIWDHIQSQWHSQDRVKEVLNQWYTQDKG